MIQICPRCGETCDPEITVCTQCRRSLETGPCHKCRKEYYIDEIEKSVRHHCAEKIIVGLPKNMDGTLGPSADRVLAFVEQLQQRLAIPVETWDERLSTAEAERMLISAVMSRRKRKKVIDSVAAAIILQGYLDHMNLKH